ncbi:MAG: hypothetical protein ABW364_15600, partial [Rhodococcus fascians]
RTVRFTAERIAETYPDSATFVESWDRAVDDLHASGLLLDDEIGVVRARGRVQAGLVDAAHARRVGRP